MLVGNAATGLAQLFESTFKNQPEFRMYISSYLELMKQNNTHFDEAQISLAEQNLWAEFYRQCLTAMGEVSFDCLAILNNQGFVLGLNKMAERVVGFSLEELQDKSVFEKFFPAQQGSDYLQCFQEGLKDPNTNMFKQRWELVLSRPNGSIFPIELRLNRLKLFGSAVLIASFKDVTKQKWTFDALQFNEERYRKMVQENADAMILIDPDSKRITEANTAFSVLLGYNSDEVYSLTLYDLMEGDTQKINDWVEFRRFRGTELLVREELNLLRRDNEWMEVEVSASVFEQREKPSLCVIIRDTSERKILKRPRLVMEKLQKTGLVEALTEVNTLLQGLNPAKGQKEKLLEVRNLHQHICELIEVALPSDTEQEDASKPHRQLPKQTFSLRAVVNSLKFLFHHTAQSRGLQIFHSVEEDVPDSYFSEPQRLQHILYQLLDNALRHTEEGNILLKVRMAQEEEDTITLLFMVRDTGQGITEDKQLGIRTLFEEGRLLENQNFKGLVAAKEYVSDLEGRIWFNSLPGQGSTFLFNLTLPLSKGDLAHLPDFDPEIPPPTFIEVEPEEESETSEDAPKASSIFQFKETEEREEEEEEPAEPEPVPHIAAKPKAKTEPIDSALLEEPAEQPSVASTQTQSQAMVLDPSVLADLEPTEILLVDDDLETMLEFQQFLNGYPVIFSFVDNGRKACDRVKEKSFDLILMDLNMPVMDGKKATTQIRKWENSEDRAPTPIIGLLTEEDNTDNCEGFLTLESKPRSKDSLLGLLSKHIPLWSEQAALLMMDNTQATAEDLFSELEAESQDNSALIENNKIMVHIAAAMASHAPPFLAKRQQDLLKIEQALVQGDMELIRVLGKSMKSAGGIYGFTGISEIGEAFESAAAAREADKINQNLDILRDYLGAVEIVVEA
ncbi:MAG: PAS domain S-box protein [Candidatus Sericytochromatia bacterium]|nr:PAS domain S-box protein [Candidatus Sericytochromatia bacterium]